MRVEAGEIYVRLLRPDDAPAQLDLLQRNREFFRPFEPRRPPEQETLEAQRELLRSSHERSALGEEYSFGVFLEDDDVLIGRANLTNIIRRAFQNAYLGYYLDEAYNGRGFMTKAVAAVVGYALGPVRLHRIQAAVMPENLPSIRVLEKVGFRREGFAANYLRIDGRWRDHYIYAITAEDPLQPNVLL
jgi:ribosomal-protein-alanine N-acetyltransferase